jgi:hypothetical protein
MRGQLLGRVPVTWPTGNDRQQMVDAMVDHWLEQWIAQKTRPPTPRRAWLSNKVLEIHVDNVTFWTVLTEQEIALFWEAPMAKRLLLTSSKREELVQTVRDYIDSEMHSRD